MASSSSVADQVWEMTSTPRLLHYKKDGKYQLNLKYTPAKGKKPIRKTSQELATELEARASCLPWRLSWEQGRGRTHPNHGASQETLEVDVSGSSSSAVPLQGKSVNYLTRLGAMKEKALKKQRCEGGADKREEWAQSKPNTPREKRCLGRGQTRRVQTGCGQPGRGQIGGEKRAGVRLTARRAYLTQRLPVLEQSTQKHKPLIDNLRMNIMQDNPVH